LAARRVGTARLEVIVADILTSLGISCEYEQKLTSKDDPNDFRLPDFTVSYEGDTFYWEHLGMLSVPSYKEQWDRKRQWYEDNGYLGRVITSEDGADGSIDAAEINRVQALLEDLAIRQGLPSKILIVHQFQFGMITHPELLHTYPHVDLVLNADGFGDRETKLEKYQALITNRPLGHAGVKLFYKYDPDIWSPVDVLQLNPPPDVVIYQ